MANLKDGSLPEKADESALEAVFRHRYLEMVRLAGLLGADDGEGAGDNITSGASCAYQPPVRAVPYQFGKVFSFPPAKDLGPSRKIDFLIHPAAIPENDAVFVEVNWFPPSTWQRLQRSGELKAWPPQLRRDPARIVGDQSFGSSFTLINQAGGLGPCVPNFNGPGYY